MIVTNAQRARDRLAARDTAETILDQAVASCLELGLSVHDIASLAYHRSLHAGLLTVKLAFIECDREGAAYFARELGEQLQAEVVPLVLDEFEIADIAGTDLVVTTYFHLTEVRRFFRANAPERAPETVAIALGPQLRTLVQLAQIPKDASVGILYSTTHEADAIQSSLLEVGLTKFSVLNDVSASHLSAVDVIVTPTDAEALRRQVEGNVTVLEFGNSLDRASVRMLSEVINEIRGRREPPDSRLGAARPPSQSVPVPVAV